MNKQILVLREGFRVLNAVAPKASAKLAEKVFLAIPKTKFSDKQKLFLRTAKMHYVPFKERYVVSYEWGVKGAPTVMLVHGWRSSAATFINLVPKLLSQGYRVISYDMISHGNSPKQGAQITCWADVLRGVLNFHGNKVEAIVGHSLGAAGILIASKLGLPTKQLILVAPCSDILDISDRFAEMLNIPKFILKMKQESIWSKYSDSIGRYGNDWGDIFNSKFKVPTLLFHDKGDVDVTPENSERVKQKWEWARLEYTENLGHQMILRDESTLDRIVSFVSSMDKSDSQENLSHGYEGSTHTEYAEKTAISSLNQLMH